VGLFRHFLTWLLVAQFVLGPGVVPWSHAQQRGGKAGGGGVPSSKDARGGKPSGAAAQEGGPKGTKSLAPTEEALPGGQALSRAIVPDEYTLGPGDSLSVNLWGEYNDTYATRVTPDGKISLPTIGDLDVKGLSLTKAETLLQTEAKRYYRNVKIGLSLTALRVFQVLVLGDVQGPGTYLATPVKRVSDLVAEAGGVSPSGSQRYIQVRRDGQVYATADLYAFLRKGDEAVNPTLHDGDVIFVPPMGPMRVFVYVTEVSTTIGGALTENSVPYTVELQEGERLSTLITEVGGASPWWDLEGVFIQRVTRHPEGVMRIPANLRRYLLEKDDSQNFLLEGGDQVYIPAQVRRVFVAGAVKTPASYAYVPGRSADAYLAQAGGASLVADLNRSFIKHADGKAEPYIGTAEIDNGDTIVVLEKLFKTWQDYFALVGTISGVIISMVGFYAAFTNFGR